MPKEQKDNKPYEEIIQNAGVVENLKKGLNLSGIPLELRVRKILKENDYRATNYRYFFPQGGGQADPYVPTPGIWRELDIKASKNSISIQLDDGTIVVFVINILAECKHSSRKDFFVFQNTDPDNLIRDHFPLRLNGNRLFLHPYGLDFSFDLAGRIIERVSEVDTASPFSREQENYNDHTTKGACEQIISAMLYFYNRQGEYIYGDYNKSRNVSSLWKKYQELLKTNEVETESKPDGSSVVKEDFVRDFVSKNIGLENSFSQVYPYTRIELVFPVMIINSERGFINAKLNENFEIESFDTDKKFYLYFYTHEEQEKYDRILKGHYTLPVFLVNLKNLPDLIRFIEDGVKKIAEETKRDLATNKYKLPYEVLFGGEDSFTFSGFTMPMFIPWK